MVLMKSFVLLILSSLLVNYYVNCMIKRQNPIYMNHFAVHIPYGKESADSIADKHGFVNKGQVSLETILFILTLNVRLNIKIKFAIFVLQIVLRFARGECGGVRG